MQPLVLRTLILSHIPQHQPAFRFARVTTAQPAHLPFGKMAAPQTALVLPPSAADHSRRQWSANSDKALQVGR